MTLMRDIFDEEYMLSLIEDTYQVVDGQAYQLHVTDSSGATE